MAKIAAVPRFAPDDVRLTDKICQAYADALFYDTPSDDGEFHYEWCCGYMDKLLLKMTRGEKKRRRS